MSPPEHRVATADDLPAIFDLLIDVGLSTDRSRITVTLQGSTYWIAEHEGRVVACTGLEHGDGSSLLRSAAVAVPWRNRGVGATLARAAIECARSRGDRRVYLFSSDAGPYWQRFGFEQIDVLDVAAALPDSPQVRAGLTVGWLFGDVAWTLDLAL